MEGESKNHLLWLIGIATREEGVKLKYGTTHRSAYFFEHPASLYSFVRSDSHNGDNASCRTIELGMLATIIFLLRY